jgi:AraC family transcriptional regulator
MEEFKMSLRVEQFPGKRIAYIRAVGPYWDVVGPAFDRLFAIAGPKGWMSRPGAVLLATYYDSPRDVPLDQLRSDVAITIDESSGESVQPEGDVQFRTMAPGKFAVYSHVGPYSGLRDAWQVAHAQVQQAGLTFREQGECFELYVNDPSSTPEAELRTDIYLPVN